MAASFSPPAGFTKRWFVPAAPSHVPAFRCQLGTRRSSVSISGPAINERRNRCSSDGRKSACWACSRVGAAVSPFGPAAYPPLADMVRIVMAPKSASGRKSTTRMIEPRRRGRDADFAKKIKNLAGRPALPKCRGRSVRDPTARRGEPGRPFRASLSAAAPSIQDDAFPFCIVARLTTPHGSACAMPWRGRRGFRPRSGPEGELPLRLRLSRRRFSRRNAPK